jgi:CheY-like chemotaxis protein
MYPRSIQVLVVEDNPSDIWLIREALRLAQIPVELAIAQDGVQATRYLKQVRQETAPRPDLVFLDLNLPGKNGYELLAEIKSVPSLLAAAIIVLSSSNAEDDRQKAYDLNASCFVTKPDSLPAYVEMARGIEKFWLGNLQLGRTA